MTSIRDLPLDKLTPSRLWAEVDPETRRLAARSLYAPEADDPSTRAEADAVIAATLRFRAAAVRRLPVDKRVEYLTRMVRVADSLASGLLLALHLDRRRPMLGAFLDALGIPQKDGLIDTEEELSPPEPEAVRRAVDVLRGAFPESEVDLYLLALIAMDREFWAALADVVAPGA